MEDNLNSSNRCTCFKTLNFMGSQYYILKNSKAKLSIHSLKTHCPILWSYMGSLTLNSCLTSSDFVPQLDSDQRTSIQCGNQSTQKRINTGQNAHACDMRRQRTCCRDGHLIDIRSLSANAKRGTIARTMLRQSAFFNTFRFLYRIWEAICPII